MSVGCRVADEQLIDWSNYSSPPNRSKFESLWRDIDTLDRVWAVGSIWSMVGARLCVLWKLRHARSMTSLLSSVVGFVRRSLASAPLRRFDVLRFRCTSRNAQHSTKIKTTHTRDVPLTQSISSKSFSSHRCWHRRRGFRRRRRRSPPHHTRTLANFWSFERPFAPTSVCQAP